LGDEIEVEHVVIADFGMACRVDYKEKEEYTSGTPGYIAPEIPLQKSD